MATHKVIDVSEHNGTINWSKVKGNCDGVIIRLGYRGYSGGKLVTDPQWTANVYGAERHDIPMGVYWYTQAITEAEAREEAAYCVQLLTGHQLAYPVYLDLEYSSSKRTGRADHLDKSTRCRCAVAWLEAIRAAGYTPGVYANEDWMRNKLDLDTLGRYDLWVAKYSSNAPSIGRSYSAWQYTSRGAVPGINHATDISHWYASYGSTAAPDSKPDYIKTFQGWLGVPADGIYGPVTRKAAVKRLQELLNNLYDCGLAVDGVFGAKTKAACGCIKEGNGGSIVYLIQGLLYCHGFDPGGLDYTFGPKTEAAVMAFQLDNGLAVDGIVGPKTWVKLAV